MSSAANFHEQPCWNPWFQTLHPRKFCSLSQADHAYCQEDIIWPLMMLLCLSNFFPFDVIEDSPLSIHDHQIAEVGETSFI